MNIKTESIINCEFYSEEETYDIEVEHKEHNFLTGDGLIVHNSAVAYIDAYFKTKYPLVFYKVLCDYEDDRATLSQFFADAKIRSVVIDGFDINKNNYEFEIDVETNTLIPGFKMIKGISKKIVEDIIAERDKEKFENIVDFFYTLEKISYNIKTIVPMIQLGALDSLYPNRKMLFKIFEKFQIYQKKKKLKTESKKMKFEDVFKVEKEDDYTLFEKFEFEQKFLEMYATSPIDYAKKYYDKNGIVTCSINEYQDESDNVLGIIQSVLIKKTKAKKNYLEIALTDGLDTISVKVWENAITPELQKKGNFGAFRLSYQDLFNSYNLKQYHILEQ